MELRWLGVGDEELVVRAGMLFDEPPSLVWTQRYLTQPGHHLAMAFVDGEPAGFVTGVELTHPDKGTEMFLYELGVDDAVRGRGIGRALVEALAGRARDLGCYGMWVLTDADNTAAMRTYQSAGGTVRGSHVMLDWNLPGDEANGTGTPSPAG